MMLKPLATEFRLVVHLKANCNPMNTCWPWARYYSMARWRHREHNFPNILECGTENIHFRGGNALPYSLTTQPDTDPDFLTIWPRCISNIHPNHNHASEPNHCAKKNTQTFTIFHYLPLITVYSSIIRVISHVTTRMVLHISWLLKLPPHNVFRILLQKNKSKGWNRVGRFEASFFFRDTRSKWQHFETWLFDFRIHDKIWSRVANNNCLFLDLLYIALFSWIVSQVLFLLFF